MQKKTIKTGIKKHHKVNTTNINKIYKKRWYKQMKIKRVITKIERYLTKEEAKSIYNAILIDKDIKEENLKIHKLTNQAYMIEIKDIPTEKKNEIKEEIKIIECTVYKTTDTLKDLKQRQENRETVQALQERKAQGEAI